MDCKIVLLLAAALTCCLCYPSDEQTPCPCGRIYQPVCSSDGNSFGNMCEFRCYAKFLAQSLGRHVTAVKQAPCDEAEHTDAA